jgi:phosphoglycerate-specific signal transduction histidine kinase
MKHWLVCLLLFAAASPLAAQREFLTNDEIDKIREAQEPNIRIKTYLLFAKQRMDQLQQQIAKDKKGRSLVVRQLLEDYAQIIDAIDTVSDDALKRHVDISMSIPDIQAAEKAYVAQLQKIEDAQPHDLDMYEVALKDAIGSTSDSLDSTKEDLKARADTVIAKSEEEKKKEEALTPKDRLKEQKAEDAKADVGTPKRKPPTLYKPGEAAAPSDVTKSQP